MPSRELRLARYVSNVRTSTGGVISPPVVGSFGGRPVLRTVDGARLDAEGAFVDDSSWYALGGNLCALHAAEVPFEWCARLEPSLNMSVPLSYVNLLTDLQLDLLAETRANPSILDSFQHLEQLFSEGSTLCHGDLRLNNVIADSDGVPYIIDWETAGCGRGEADLGSLFASLLEYRSNQVGTLAEYVSWTSARMNLISEGYEAELGRPCCESFILDVFRFAGWSLLGRAWVRSQYVRSSERGLNVLLEYGRALLLNTNHAYVDHYWRRERRNEQIGCGR